MLPKQQRYTLVVLLLILISVAGTTAIANSKVSTLFEEVSLAFDKAVSTTEKKQPQQTKKKNAQLVAKATSTAMFATIIQGADNLENCDDNGFTVARFNLCGDYDDRIISLSGGPYSNVSWQVLGGSCSPDINTECPNTGACYTEVADQQTFTLDASSVPSTQGAEYRVVANGQIYYFKVKKSTINQTYEKQDFICGVDGRIQITNLSSAYEFSINDGSGFGAWQGPIFPNLAAGTYNVKARLKNTANTCEYPYEPIIIEERNIDITATFQDALCNGDTGSITVNASGVPGPYKYTLLNSNGVRQEFTAFMPDSSYTFSAVGFGSYIVQVETYQCTGDPGNGINPPRQHLDVNGNTLTIGAGASALDASTEVNSSFGCSDISSVDIILNTNGGSAPYTFTVNNGAVQPAFGNASTDTGSTIFTVTSAGTYDFIITDSNGCTISASSDVETLSPPDVTVAGIDGSCSNGGAKLDFTINNGRGYNISFRESASAPWVSTPQISVAASTYNDIEVRYQQGDFECTLAMPSITVNTVGSLTGSANKVSDVTCTSSGTEGGQIDFVGPFSGGSGSGYEFSIDGVHFSSITSYSDLSPGTYTPIIRDAGGCRLELTSIEILDIDPPTDLAFVQSNVSCSAGTSDVQLTPTSNAAINRYEIISPSYVDNGNNDTFIGLLTSQAYIFQITDVNGCTYTEGFRPIVTSSIRVRVKSGGDLRVCNGAADGSGTFIVDGFSNTYTYDINGGLYTGGPQNDAEVILPLSGAGTYTITITDSDTGCTDTASFDIEEATTLDLTSSVVTPMSCDNNNIGRVEAITTGGWGGYKYALEYPSGYNTGVVSGNIFGNLTETTDALDPSDVYTLTAIDSEGCSTTFTFDLEARTAPSISIAAADLCYSPTNTPSVTVTSSGGGTGHVYRINNGGFTASPTFNNLFPGTYTIEVQDDNNCRSSVNITIPPQINVQLSVDDEIPCAGSGTMGITVNGGNISDLTNTSYTIFKDGAPVASATGLQLPSNSFDFAIGSLEHGTYSVSVEDNNGCTDISEPIIFEAPSTITATHRVVGPSCGDANSGFIDITPDPTVGIPPYEIKFGPAGSLSYSVADDGAYQYSSQTTYSGLPIGDYEYVVKDGRGCLIPGVVTVTVSADGTVAPNATVAPIDATCIGNVVSGGIEITTVSGGVPEFVYIVEDLFGNEITRVETDGSTIYPLNITHPDIVQGNYQLVTLDSRGCRDVDTVTIGNATVQIQPDNTLLPPTCTPGGFPYCVDIVGGTGPFDIRILDGTNPPYISLGGTPPSEIRRYCFPNIQFGEVFTVEVVDTFSGCMYQEIIEVPQGPSTVDVNLAIDNATCIPGNEVGLTYSVTGTTGLLDIEIRNTETGDLFIAETRSETNFTYQVPEGAYSILVFDNGTQCSDGAQAEALLNAPRVDILENINSNCNAEGQLTVRGSGGAPFATGSPYEYAYVPAGTPVDENGTLTPGDPSDDFTDASTVTLPGAPGAGIEYDIWVRDSRNCSYRISAAIITEDPPLPAPTFLVSNQCDVTAASFTIDLSLPAYINTPTFTLGGVSQLGTRANDTDPWTTTFTVNSVGVYHVDVMDANGCVGAADPEVYQVLSATGEFSRPPNCTDSDGEITVYANGGSGNFNFELQDSLGNYIADNATGVFTGVPAGEYQVVLVDDLVNDGTIYCPFTVYDIISTIPTAPSIIADGASSISCNGADDGSINIILAGGSDVDGIAAYNLYTGTLPLPSSATPTTTNLSGSFTGLSAGDYVAEVVTDLGCTDLVEVTISEPAVFSIEASAPDFACEPGANRYSSTIISINVLDPGTVGSGYQYSITGFSNYQSGNTFEIVDNGYPQDITVYAIDGNGCQTTFDVPRIYPPTDVVPSIINVEPLNCRDDEVVRIQVLGTTDFTVNTISVASVTPVTNTTGNDYVDVLLPASGDYLFEVVDNTVGCTYPMPVHTVIEPLQPRVVISEAKPVSCANPGNDGALFITVSDYSGIFDYIVYEADDISRTTPLATGTFNTANYPDGNGDEARIENLPGGNLIVDIVSVGMPFCSATSNVANIRTPNGPLTVNAVAIGNVSCTNDTGEIEATGTGGWDNVPYEYRLFMSADGGATYTTEIAAFSNLNNFTGLSYGFYQVEIRDSELCTDTFEIELDEVPQIVAGIREPQGLDCPNGNNAVLEAYDITSGDSATAIAGASGGFAGAGYNYTLLYLNSNDNTDIVSQSGLQNTPTFIGDSGGYISAGWYAIEVSSSFGCSFVTDAYYVDPPPPIQPLLVQTRVPGCGGDGEMRLTVENPDPSFSYEYLRVENNVAIGGYEPMNGTSILISGVEGITYQFDVRKVNSAGACPSIRSNGITMTNATGITLLPNLPDDISCASELDGRIESFVNGGVGEDLFYLFEGDPIDAFNPVATATMVRGPQDNGTFEGLPEGTNYYIAVTSGSTCMDIAGPFEIVRPEPIVFDAVAANVTCSGEADGSITITVSEGGVGLIQFAIAPNFNEFFSDAENPGSYTFDELEAGSYEILIQDENGCFEKDVITIEAPDQIQIVDIETMAELCIGANDGSMSFNIIGGTPFTDVLVSNTPYYEYKIEMIDPVDETGTATFQPYLGDRIENLQGGASYAIYVQDVNLCGTMEVFIVNIGVDLSAAPQVQYGCDGIFPTNTTTINWGGDVQASQLMFALDPIDPTDPISANATEEYIWGDLPPGDHTVYIYHENGCTNSVEFSIDSYEPLSLSVDKTGPNEIVAVATGGFGNYEFFFNSRSYGTETTYTTNESGMVNVRVVDQMGCELQLDVPFEFTGMLEFPNFFSPDGDNLNDIWSPNNRDLFDGVVVKIYDRYGRVVAVLDEVSGWDGTYEGKEVPTGDYWYVVNANTAEIRYVGHFTLYR
ncbi:T9SS type B sorting domain-containing protein [Maribacter sp. MAR_2009_72]|uniref:T9SS type B sorting domain-containing protein n=1 Tax=Maribacter sp. MAR_2009_72 TaxID=1250050 RepID=UPI00119C5F49|nr:T9SS type B sorting domain-containing protein [Maribacter sp. MAR_2009_72]TVZ17436.1 gliding motility-associated-like protein [Maribacter sp. MAR_2009_72]